MITYIEDGSYPEATLSNDTFVTYQCVGGSDVIGALWFVNGNAFHANTADTQNATHFITTATVPSNFNATNVRCCLQHISMENVCHARTVDTGII